MPTRICPDIAALDLHPAPIPPAWIRAGTPVAHVLEIGRSRDGLCTSFVWSCTEGVFEWRFGVDEIVHILEGAVTVTDAEGARVRLGPGDVASFPAGVRSVWEVHGHVRKFAICRRPVPVVVGVAVRTAGWLGDRLGGLAGPRLPLMRSPWGPAVVMLLAMG